MALGGLLLDLEGVLYQASEPVEGAVEAVAQCRDMGLNIRFLTNTTTKPKSAVVERLNHLGFDASSEDVFTPASAARSVLEELGAKRIRLAALSALAGDFDSFEIVSDGRADAVVMGDLHRDFTWELLNALLTPLLEGAALIALHKNRRCRREEGLSLDLGPFVAALEYAAETEAVVVGKPARAFFDSALQSMGLSAREVMMVGDDLESDIDGAHAAGLKATQVRTGKYTSRDDDHDQISPDHRIDSISDLPGLLEELG